MHSEPATDTIYVSDEVLYDLLHLSPRSLHQASRILYNLPSVITLLQNDAAASTRFGTPWEDDQQLSDHTTNTPNNEHDIPDVHTGDLDNVDEEEEGDKKTNGVVSEEMNCERENSRTNKHHSVLLKGAEARGVKENLESIFLSQIYHYPQSLVNGAGRNGSRRTMRSSAHTLLAINLNPLCCGGWPWNGSTDSRHQ